MVKAIYAWWYYGFYTGDDVEIHEMVFAAIFGWDWQAWDIRSAFYPMVFIYPAVAAVRFLRVEHLADLQDRVPSVRKYPHRRLGCPVPCDQ